jgi:hypothetical protein
MKGMEGMRPPLLRGLKPASLCVAVPLGYLRWLLVEEVADEVADAGGEQSTASHGVEVVAVVVVVVGCC